MVWLAARASAACITAPPALCLVASAAGCDFCHSYSQAALWPWHTNNIRPCCIDGSKFKCSQVHLVPVAPKTKKRERKALERVASIALKWALKETGAPSPPRALRWIWSPVNMRNVVALLFGNKRSHHSLQNIKNNPTAELLPPTTCGNKPPSRRAHFTALVYYYLFDIY